MLEVRLRHRFGAFALDVGFDGPAGGITALFGPSGCGKTTVIQAIAGLLRPDGGRIVLDGEVLFCSERGIDRPPGVRRVGYVFQEPRLFPHLSVERNLLYGFRRAPRAARRIRPEPVIELLGLAPLLGRRPAGLSGGEKSRVGLGRALLAQPRLLLMDEPLAALDRERKDDILPYLARLRTDFALPVVYVSHAIEEVARLADRVVLMEAGRVIAAGPVVDVMADLDLLAHLDAFEGGAVLPVTVAGHETADDLTRLAFEGGELMVPRLPVELGQRLTVRIRARDVMLAVHEPLAISALNVLPAEVRQVQAEAGAFAEVQLAVGPQVRLVARITRRSAARLALVPGQRLFAVVKSVAIDRRSLGLPPPPTGPGGGP
jgi:molybdate transport system ATP-binding protein